MNWYFGGFIVLTVLTAFFFVIIGFKIILALFGGNKRFRGPWQHKRDGDALTILAGRYARGEIDEAEYKSRKAVLSEE